MHFMAEVNMQTFKSAKLIDNGAAVALTNADGMQTRFHAVLESPQ